MIFLSHILLDIVASITYHPPKAHTEDRFWVWFHIIVYSIAILLIVIFAHLWYVLLLSCLVDVIDWFILRPVFGKKHKKIGSGIVHKTLIDPLTSALRIPNWRERKAAALVELSMDLILVLMIMSVIPW